MIERIRFGWHMPKLRGHLTNVTARVNENSHCQIMLTLTTLTANPTLILTLPVARFVLGSDLGWILDTDIQMK